MKEINFMKNSQSYGFNFFKLILIIILNSFLYCVSSSNYQFIYPEYEKLNFFSASLMVMALNTDIISKDVQEKLLQGDATKVDMFNQQEREYFNNYMGPALAEKTTAKIYGIDPLFKPTDIEFIFQRLQFENELDIKMFVPLSGKIKYYNVTPHYVLFFEDLKFEKDFREESGGLGRGTVQRYTMQAGVKYLLWDNNKQRIAAYGKLENDLNFLDFPTRENYVQLFEKWALLIVQKSPLVRKF
jgi:hypothetical protein